MVRILTPWKLGNITNWAVFPENLLFKLLPAYHSVNIAFTLRITDFKKTNKHQVVISNLKTSSCGAKIYRLLAFAGWMRV